MVTTMKKNKNVSSVTASTAADEKPDEEMVEDIIRPVYVQKKLN